MRGAGDLEGRAERRRQRRDGAGVVEAVQHERRRCARRLGSTLKVTSVKHAERALGAGQELHEVEAGDVLHHPPAGLDDLARAR